MTVTEKKNLGTGLAFISPWLIGFILMGAYPVVMSAFLSLQEYSVLSPPVYIGTDNYGKMAQDKVLWQALGNTVYFAAVSVPLSLLTAFVAALLLHVDVPGRKIFRLIYFLPSLVPMVCLAVLWRWMLNGQLGLINTALQPVLDAVNAVLGSHLTSPNWLAEPAYAKLGLIVAGLWTVGNTILIFLAGLQEVPRDLYEAAEIDGCKFWQKTLHITLPLVSPVIYFNGIMALIGSFQIFAVPFVITGGGDGPGRSLLFISTYIYQNAFEYWSMGYACAIALMLFVIILVLTLFATRLSQRHIYYAGK